MTRRVLLLLLILAAPWSAPVLSPAQARSGAPHANGAGISGTAPILRAEALVRRAASPTPSPAPVHVTGSEGPSPTASMPATYSGTATWYCSDGRDGSPRSACPKGYRPSDLVAAIDRKDSEFRKGDTVRVTYGDKSVVVRIVDICGCPDRRVIDLSIGAFRQLGHWGYGVLPVTISEVTK